MKRICLSALALLLHLSLQPLSAASGAVVVTQPVEEEEVRLELAQVLGYQRKYNAAIEQYQILLQSNPNLLIAKIGLAQLYVQTKQLDKAEALIKDIATARLRPEDLNPMAQLMVTLGHYDQAEGLIRSHLRLHPEDLTARFQYAQILSWAKRYPEAEAEYHILLSERPNDLQLRRHYALLLVWMGEPEKAKAELEATLGDHAP